MSPTRLTQSEKGKECSGVRGREEIDNTKLKWMNGNERQK